MFSVTLLFSLSPPVSVPFAFAREKKEEMNIAKDTVLGTEAGVTIGTCPCRKQGDNAHAYFGKLS